MAGTSTDEEAGKIRYVMTRVEIRGTLWTDNFVAF